MTRGRVPEAEQGSGRHGTAAGWSPGLAGQHQTVERGRGPGEVRAGSPQARLGSLDFP